MTPLLPALVPLGSGVKADQTLRAKQVALPQQLRDINVEWGIGLGGGEELVDGGQSGGDGEGRAPGGLEGVEADLAGLEVHVRVADGSDKLDIRRGERIGRRNADVEEPAAVFVCSARHASHHSCPVRQLVVVHGA